MAFDENGVAIIPAYAWEIQWSVQIVENRVYKEKYYGGYNTSMVFEYDRLGNSYDLAWAQNTWDYPQECFDNTIISSRYDGLFRADRVVNTAESSVDVSFSYGSSEELVYKEAAWFIYKLDDPLFLLAYGGFF